MTEIQELEVDEAFERTYTLELLVEMPNSPYIARHYLPHGVPNGGPILRVTSRNGYRSLVIIAGEAAGFKVVTWPNPDKFLALPSAWLVDSTAPEKSQRLPGFEVTPVHYVLPVPQHNVVLIGHDYEVHCYDRNGMRWERNDMFCCDDPSLDVVSDVLLVTAHNHMEDPGDNHGPLVKRLDLQTGKQLD